MGCFEFGRIPVVSIGFSYFQILMALFICFALAYMVFLMIELNKTNPIGCYICGIFALINLALLFGVLLGDPGIPPSIYHRYSKHRNFNENNNKNDEESIEP